DQPRPQRPLAGEPVGEIVVAADAADEEAIDDVIRLADVADPLQGGVAAQRLGIGAHDGVASPVKIPRLHEAGDGGGGAGKLDRAAAHAQFPPLLAPGAGGRPGTLSSAAYATRRGSRLRIFA